MITGAHIILYSTDAEADRAFLRDVLEFPHLEIGHGWLLFRLPEAEAAVHPAESNGNHELWLMCDDLEAAIATLKDKGVACDEPGDQRWGRTTRITLPGGGKLGLYQPRHARP
jgi:catechol 2,3-dioxygenase-like lactoylglutathione lyase family enzyme